MQADRWLVEHEQRVDQRSAERRGEVDALHFSPGQRARLAVEREVTKADFAQIRQARANFLQQEVGGFINCRWQVKLVDQFTRARNRQQHEVVHRQAGQRAQNFVVVFHRLRAVTQGRLQHAVGIGLAAEPPRQRIGFEARAVAGLAWRVGAVLRQQYADVHLVGFGFQPLEEMLHAVPGAGPGLAPALPFVFAFEHPALLFGSQIAPRRIERNAAQLRVFKDVVLTLVETRRLPRPHRAVADRFRFVRHDQAEVDANHAPEAAAILTGAHWRVE